MNMTVDQRDGVKVVELQGDLDTTTVPSVHAGLIAEVADGVRLVLDLHGVRYMSSAGLRLMLSVYRKAQERGGDLVLVGLSDAIRDTMEVTGFLNFFQAYETLEDGLRVLGSPR